MTGSRWMKLLSALMVLGLLAAACGGDDSGGDGGGGDAAGDEGGDPDAGETPVYGGKLVFAREAETLLAWTPADMVCDVACHQAIKSVYDPLTMITEDGEAVPFVLESIEPNADFTEWTLTARDGVTFHDGTPLDADALIDHFERGRDSTLIGKVFSDVVSQEKIDAKSIVVTMSNPWTHFPVFLAGQPGYIGSPTWLAAVDDGSAAGTEPVGTGPFVFAEYNDGDNFRVTRNESYWNTDADGNAYPYLDEIEFVVQAENQTRDSAIISGEIDITHMDSGDSIERLRQEVDAGTIDMYELSEAGGGQEAGYILIHVTNEESPVSDKRIRQAMAFAIDQEFRNEARNAGIFDIANGPWSKSEAGYLEETGFPTFDLERAKELVADYEADTGQEAAFSYTTAADPFNLQTAELYQQFWEEAGMTVTLDQIEQGSFIGEALAGNFEAFGWRNHSGFDPDTQSVWWNSENAGDVGVTSLNFGRIKDDVIDENLRIIRESNDDAERTAAAEAINLRFAEEVYNIWTDWTLWTIPHQTRVNGVQTPVNLPGDVPSATHGIGFGGAVNVMQLWVSE